MKDRRARPPRVPASLAVQCIRAGRVPLRLSGRTVNVGGGGVAVELPRRLRCGTRLALRVRTAIGALHLAAEVLWTRQAARQRVLHGLRLAGGSDVLDLPVGVLLGAWLGGLTSRVPAPRRKTARASRG